MFKNFLLSVMSVFGVVAREQQKIHNNGSNDNPEDEEQ
jgi:hypothetical protein